ncbi:spore germination protein [Paenibacillus sp. GYB003]|uniref:spore germination protein n=1 Tax=Paenibacillus sp. GYB003 TaxID=2994392 RepID=UPI002F961A6C
MINEMQALLQGRSDIVVQIVESNGLRCHIQYLSGAVNVEMLQRHVLGPMCSAPDIGNSIEWLHKVFIERSFFSTPYRITGDVTKAMHALLAGQVVLTAEGSGQAICFPFAKQAKRAIEPPQNEKSIRGPKDAFVEDLETNLSLIRQRIQSPDLKVEHYTVGSHTGTEVLIMYMQGLCKPQLIDDIRQKMNQMNTDRIIGSNDLEEAWDENRFSPFPNIQNTERPDVAAAALLEGRMAVIVAGTPNSLLIPAPLVVFLQAAEDYYQRYFFSTWIRWIRYLFLFVSMVLPSTYVAITTFHPEMIPASLLISIAASRDIVPFPAVLEAFMMELTFEVLREAGQRIPSYIGQTISIVGALVIGEAAVQAGIVSAPMVIIVSLTGISSFIIPNFSLNLAVRFMRFMLLLLAGVFGLLGVLMGIIAIYIHLLSIRSFGTPYLSPVIPLKPRGLDDVLARFPWPKLKRGS